MSWLAEDTPAGTPIRLIVMPFHIPQMWCKKILQIQAATGQQQVVRSAMVQVQGAACSNRTSNMIFKQQQVPNSMHTQGKYETEV